MRPGDPPWDADPVVVCDDGRVRVTVVPVGWVAVRRAHHEYAGPWPLRYPAIATDPRWAPWMPVNVVLVEHTAGVVLVDTGEAVDQPPGHFGCGDQVAERIYRRYLRLPVRPGTDAPSRLRALGVDPGSVDTVVLTHLHADHTGNLPAFPRARVLVGPDEQRGYPGATACRLAGRDVVPPRLADGPVGGFPASLALTEDGAVRAVPLPGHTPGHLGVLVADDAAPGGGRRRRVVLAAGDVAFDPHQLRRRATPGIARDRTANRASQALVADVLGSGGQVLLAHHLPPAASGRGPG